MLGKAFSHCYLAALPEKRREALGRDHDCLLQNAAFDDGQIADQEVERFRPGRKSRWQRDGLVLTPRVPHGTRDLWAGQRQVTRAV